MSELAKFTTVFRARLPNDNRVAKRNRRALSCVSCRTRKLKCDRGLPCGACVHRGDGNGCRFGYAPAATAAMAPGPEPGPGARSEQHLIAARGGRQQQPALHREKKQQQTPEQRQEIQLRLMRLEQMVQNLIANPESDATPRDLAPITPRSELSDARLAACDQSRGTCESVTGTKSRAANKDALVSTCRGDNDETAYYGATHWTAVLESIQGIRTSLLDSGTEVDASTAVEVPAAPQPPPLSSTGSPDILFGAPRDLTVAEVLDCLPPRHEADNLLAVYFTSRFTCVFFLHVHQFRRQYEAFWADPGAANFLWISMLFSILAVGSGISALRGTLSPAPACDGAGAEAGTGDREMPQRTSAFYLECAARCLQTGGYLKPQAFSVEALLCYAHAKNYQSREADGTVWTLFGLATRLAQRRGYHKDASPSSSSGSGPSGGGGGRPALTPFQGEMRRRTWVFVEIFDLLLSFQMGIPPIIHEDSFDEGACTVRNISDDDFDEDSPELPPPRPATDPAHILYCSLKATLSRVLRRVVRHALAPARPPYTETMALHARLAEWRATLPACLGWRPIRSTPFSEPNWVIMQRLMLKMVYRKSLCILHRTYLSHDKTNAEYKLSRETCGESALEILELQIEFEREIRPGGRLWQDRFMLSSYTLHDFLMAAMVVSLALKEATWSRIEQRDQMVAALQGVHRLWTERSGTSREAVQAMRVISAMLKSVLERPQPGADVLGSALESMPGSSPPQASALESVTSNGLRFGGDDAIDLAEYMCLDEILKDPEYAQWTAIDRYIMSGKHDETMMGC